MPKPNKIWAVMPAAGSGSRMQADRPKQYLELAGKTVLEHSIGAVLNATALEAMVVCVPPQDDRALELIKLSADLFARVENNSLIVTPGGKTRAHSVLNGLEALVDRAQGNDWVIVHDAARPCVSAQDINRLVGALKGEPVGGILATRAKDTLKSTDSGEVVSTLDRDNVWHALTPQMFRYSLLKTALRSALEQNLAITDESSALELAGYRPKLIEGAAANIKITTDGDLIFAEKFLGGLRKQFKKQGE